jgi:hypothetical protein
MKMLKMKNTCFLFIATSIFVSAAFLVSCGPTHVVVQEDSYAPAPAPAVEEVSYQSFYDQLSPYGNWINYPGYGYVWMPNAGPDFRPYSTNGNWIYTDAGWTWASNYNWGWAPFHYGRWFLDNNYGWMWIPGNEWAPAWVTWRGNSEYYGWAPLGPHVSAEMAMNNYNPPVNYWNFIPTHYMGNPGWHNYYVNENRNLNIVNNTTIINNYSGTNKNRYAYAPGPDPNEVRRVSGNNFHTVQVREANTPGERYSGAQYTVYRPSVNANASRANAGARPAAPAPVRYQTYNGQPSTANGQPSTFDHPLPAGHQTYYGQPISQPQPVNRPNNNVQPNQPPVNNPNYNGQQTTANPPAHGSGGQSGQQTTANPPAHGSGGQSAQTSSSGRPVEPVSGGHPGNVPNDHYRPQGEPVNPANRSTNNQPVTSTANPPAHGSGGQSGQRSKANGTRPVQKPIPAQPQTQSSPSEKTKNREPE